MGHSAGIDVLSLELSSVCVVGAQGKIEKEAKVASACSQTIQTFISVQTLDRLTGSP
jgi:hypothetical protein